MNKLGDTPESRERPDPKVWTPNTWYLVEVAFNKHNPIHRSMFYTGFLNGKNDGPGGYSGFQAINYAGGDETHISEAYYLKIVKRLFSTNELRSV